MPNRILKETIRTSRSVNALTDFQFRVWAYLITYVDDYGRGSADPEILKGMVFTRRKGVTEGQIEKALADLANIGMVNLYEVDGEPFFCFPNWSEHQQVRNQKSKFPSPEEGTVLQSIDINCNQLQSIDINCTRNPIQSNPNPNPESEDARARAIPDSFSPKMKEAVEKWLSYKRERREAYKPQGQRALLSQIENKLKLWSEADVIGLIDECMANGWKGIIWDRLEKKPHRTPSAAAYDLDEFEQLMENYVPRK